MTISNMFRQLSPLDQEAVATVLGSPMGGMESNV